ncbi:MAG: division/cell wall cluster transcriptional repressor MraZ [Tissierellia bacterium]|nr:division/cell wall cluster transcriptional repressor MraZ [Tissierellia bacterium]
MFIGEYQHNMDSKGRVMIPSKFRDELGAVFYVTKGMENCLFIYEEEEWKALANKINAANQLSRKEARGFARLFYAGAINAELDKQGRILIPANLRNYAGIERETYILGVGNRIEIWSKENWDNYVNDDDLNYDNLTDKIMDLNI